MKLSFSLSAAKSQAVGAAPSLKRPAAFASLNDEDTIDAAPTSNSDRKLGANKKLIAQNVESSKAARKRMEAEKKVDETVYQYDEQYDLMKESELRKKEAKAADAKERKVSSGILVRTPLVTRANQPKYIGAALISAQTRRLDYIRAEEKLYQREREAEGDEFKDKEEFVTQAYKDQMAEVRKAEAEEKQREGMSSVASPATIRLICQLERWSGRKTDCLPE